MRSAITITLSLTAASFAGSLAAQEEREPRFRIGLGLAGGSFDYETDGSGLDGDADAGMFRLSFEATTAKGLGGGLRLESVGTDDDLFTGTGFASAEAANGTLFGHFTYRIEAHRFAMPLRIGLLLNGLTLTENTTDDEVTFASVGPYFEIAPEVVLVRGGKTQWSLFGEVGVGVAGTAIDIEGDSRDFESTSSFAGLELGTRLLIGPIELGLSYVGRWQSMDESDPEGVDVVLGYDAEFQGGMFSIAVVF